MQCAMELYPSKWFIPHDKLMIEDDLGSGAFGMVKKAKVYRLSEEEEFTTVAVKMLKGFFHAPAYSKSLNSIMYVFCFTNN